MESTTKVKTTAKDFFLHLFTMVLLYVSFGSLLSLLFDYINYAFPDALSYADPYSGSMRFSIAILIILFPVFLFATWYLNKDLRSNPEKQDMGIRKWLLYLTLFAATGIVIGDLVTLVNTFLNGEITTRFTLKVLTILMMSGLVLWYYILDIKGSFMEKPMIGHSIGIIAGVVVVVSVVGGFFVIGSPSTQRLVRFDQQKIYDLQNIQYQVVNYWQQKQNLPQTLDDLKDSISEQVVPVDTQSGKPYEYSVIGPVSFKLCGDFNKEGVSNNYSSYQTAPIPAGKTGVADNWQHGVGYVCFDRAIDPELYPPTRKL